MMSQFEIAPIYVLLSGGIDSTCCLEFYRSLNRPIRSIFVEYNQPCIRSEKLAAEAIAGYYDVELAILSVDGYDPFGSGEIQGRNALLLSLATTAIDPGPAIISIGIHAGTEYLDCSRHFIDSFQNLLDSFT